MIKKYEGKDGGQQALDESSTNLIEINSITKFGINSNTWVAGKGSMKVAELCVVEVIAPELMGVEVTLAVLQINSVI